MDPMILIFGGVAIVLLFILGSFMAALFQKVGPNQAMIISGGGGVPKLIVGGGTVVLPLVNKMQILSLENMSVRIAQNTTLFTKTNVPIQIEATAIVKVRGDEQSIQTAAEQFLGKDQDEISRVAQTVLSGHMRYIVGSMTVEELLFDKNQFDSRFAEVALADMAKMGLTVVSVAITEIQDKVGYIDSIAAKPDIKAMETLSTF